MTNAEFEASLTPEQRELMAAADAEIEADLTAYLENFKAEVLRVWAAAKPYRRRSAARAGAFLAGRAMRPCVRRLKRGSQESARDGRGDDLAGQRERWTRQEEKP